MNWADFHFLRPLWLLALIPYGAIGILLLRQRLGKRNWSAVCDAVLLPYLLQDKPGVKKRVFYAAGTTAAGLAILALAGPAWERLPAPVFRNDSALVIALDLSRSMEAQDVKPNRLIRARYKIADILGQRKDGQTALVVYAGEAFTVTPLTTDTETIASQLEALTPAIMPVQGSNTAAALAAAVNLFRQAGLQRGQIILVTDGVDPDQTLASAKALKPYILSVLAVGTAEGAPIPLSEGGFLKQHESIVLSRLDAPALKKIAQAGGGIYTPMTADDTDIQRLMALTDRPSSPQQQGNSDIMLEQWADRGPWLALPIVPLALLLFRRGILGLVFALLLPLPKTGQAFEWHDLWYSRDVRAQQAFNDGRFDQAAQLFDDPAWKAAAQYRAGRYEDALKTLRNGKAPDPYNLGNALAQSGRLPEAVKAYEDALARDPGNKDAAYNKKIVEEALQKQKNRSQQNQQNQQGKKPDDQNGDSRQAPSRAGEQQPSSDREAEKADADKAASSERPEPGDESPSRQPPVPDRAGQASRVQRQPKEAADKTHRTERQADSLLSERREEALQANEQWLNRIPDDPAGLLKRKFRYQYSRRHPGDTDNPQAW